MPEAPEVKIMMDSVKTLMCGKKLIAIKLLSTLKTKGLDILQLPQNVTDATSKGKLGYITLSNGHAITIGFGMTGNIRIKPDAAYLKLRGETYEQYMKHAAVKFVYVDIDGNEDEIYYHSVRHFGFVHGLATKDFKKKLSEIGESILDTELENSVVIRKYRRHQGKNICVALMDQSIISGIGNYIKAEILYRSHVYPLALVRDLNDETLVDLYQNARTIAQEAYGAGGASLYTYTGLHGDKSDFKDTLCVYGKHTSPDGLRVKTMTTPDKRTTHWVPETQIIGLPARIVIEVTRRVPVPVQVQVPSP